MANSGIFWIDILFNWAVRALYDVAGLLNITYEEINVWGFLVLWPALTLFLIASVIQLWRRNSRLRLKLHGH